MKSRPYIIQAALTAAFLFVNSANTTRADEQAEGVHPANGPVASSGASAAASGGETIANSVGMKLVFIEPGAFWMGSSAEERGRKDDESPQHLVTLTKGFYAGVTEVTQAQWCEIMKTRPWSGKEYVREGDRYPATYVSWDDAVEFCKKLSQKEGRKYRLPSEAEWEYACRAGTKSAYDFGEDDRRLQEHAWFRDDAYDMGERSARAVAQKKPNSWGLYDVYGNVWEWCSDWYSEKAYRTNPATDPTGPSDGASRVLRGGSWINAPWDCRSATRTKSAPEKRGHYWGFRVVLDLN